MYNPPHILSTKALTIPLIEKAAAENLVVETAPFIKTEAVNHVGLTQQVTELINQHIVAVFTSMNAAEAVANFIDNRQPEWKIYALGSTTQKMVSKQFPGSKVYGGGENAAALAEQIINSREIDAVTFFCGDQRRDELPAKLQANGILVKELVVYTTRRQPQKLQRFYDGIMFFSPSAVETFFESNSIPPATILFAIGNTTAKTIEQYSTNKVITSDRPGKEELLDKVILHFNTINQH